MPATFRPAQPRPPEPVLVQRLKPRVLGCEAAFGGDVDNQQDLPSMGLQRSGVAVDVLERNAKDGLGSLNGSHG